jgi:hypothetical protein
MHRPLAVFSLLILAVTTASATQAQEVGSATGRPSVLSVAVRRAASERRADVARYLPLWAASRLSRIESDVLRRVPERTPLDVVFEQEVRRSFPHANAAQRRVLKLAAAVSVLERLEELQNRKDSSSEAGRMDMLMLQQMMDCKNELENMISNLMRQASENSQTVLANLKAS